MITLINDVKYAFRQLRKSPGFTICTVLVLALGIGTSTAIFSVLEGLLYRSLPFNDCQQIMSVWSKSSNPNLSHFPVLNTSSNDYEDWVAQNTVFSELAAMEHRMLSLTGRDTPLALTGCAATPNYFDVFRKPPVLGRSFRPEERVSDQGKVVILSHSLWQRAFEGSPDILGQNLTLDNEVYSVIGVAHRDMEFRQDFEIQFYVPLANAQPGRRGHRNLWVLGRLSPDVTQDRATVAMKTTAARLEKQYPDTNTTFGAKLIPLHELLFGKAQGSVVILFAAGVLVLLIACANVANLMMSRTGKRSQEMAVRSALGAGRLQLSRVMLCECLLLSLMAGVLGFIGVLWSMDVLGYGTEILSQSGGLIGATGNIRVSINPLILIFSIVLSVFTTLCFGLIPVWQTSQVNPLNALHISGRGSSQNRQRSRLSNLLVSAEIATTFILLIGACLVGRNLAQLNRHSVGFNPANLMTMQLKLPESNLYKNDQKRATFCQSVLERMNNIPGVSGAASTSIHPLSGSNLMDTFQIRDQGTRKSGDITTAEYRTVSTDYFSTIGLPLTKGRLFQKTDDSSGKVILIDQEFARLYFADKDPIGQRIMLSEGREREIIGVVGNHQTGPLIHEQAVPHMYEPISQRCQDTVTFIVKTRTDPLTAADAMRKSLWAVNPDQPIGRMQSMQDIVRDTLSTQRMSGFVLGFFATSALLITLIGIYGVMSLAVSQRTREIGIRMAFGAMQGDVVKSIMRVGLLFTGLGLVAGLAGSLVLCRLMGALLYNTSPADPLSFGLVIIFIGTISLLACYIPARRATKIDPMEALRYE